jgi:D-sedoheptulose 7-phosphate isomerase
MKCIVFTGKNFKDNEKIVDEIISVPAINTSRIQEVHIMIGQMLCNALEYKLGLSPLVKEESTNK